MRPLSLRLKGFRSWAGDHTIDFDGRGLVGIVGPNGAGKSSLFDAVTFALYGRTVTAQNRTRRLINQNLDVASVDLTFATEGRLWRVVRTMRRRGGTDVGLYTASNVDNPDWEAAEGVDPLARTVTRRIEELLGVDFDGFRRSVLLAQGQFDLFLSAPPAERDQILKRVFGYDRIVEHIRSAARAAVAEHETETGRLEIEQVRLSARIDSNADIDGRLAHARGSHSELVERHRGLAELTRPWQTVTVQASENGRAVTDHTDRLRHVVDRRGVAAADRCLHRLTADLATLEAAASVLGTARVVYQDATAATVRAAERYTRCDPEQLRWTLDETDRAIAELERNDRDTQTVQREQETVRGRVADARRRRDRVATEAEETAADAASAADAAEETDRRISQLRAQARRAADTAHAANRLRAALTPGSQCPVCDSTVTDIPDHDDSDVDEDSEQLDALETEYRQLRRRLQNAERGATQARVELADARAAADAGQRLADELANREQRLADDRAATVNILHNMWGTDWRDGWRTRRAEHSRLRDERDRSFDTKLAARRDVIDREVEHAGAAATVTGTARTLRTAAERAGFRWERPDTPDRMAAAAEQFVDNHRRAIAFHARRRAISSRRVRNSRRLLDMWRSWVDIEPGTDLAHETVRVAADIRHWQRTIREYEETAAELETMRQRLAAVETLLEGHQHALDDARRVASDMTDSRFVKYLMDEHRARLIDVASRWLAELTDGRYRFSIDNGTISVADQVNAGSVRPASGLSGGEKFLSSLALAMALTETVTADGSRLGAFFLDEGFGTLDPEHLDLAMRGVETVAARTGTLVLVVSHVPEMRDRIDDLIVLERGPSGTTVLTAGDQVATPHPVATPPSTNQATGNVRRRGKEAQDE